MKHTLKLGMLVAALTTAELASAEPIIVFDTFRLVSANRITHNNFALGPWSDSITGKDNAGQDTTISNVFVGGSGFADARLGDNQDLSSSSAAELRASFFLELITHASLDVELFQAGDGGFARASEKRYRHDELECLH